MYETWTFAAASDFRPHCGNPYGLQVTGAVAGLICSPGLGQYGVKFEVYGTAALTTVVELRFQYSEPVLLVAETGCQSLRRAERHQHQLIVLSALVGR